MGVEHCLSARCSSVRAIGLKCNDKKQSRKSHTNFQTQNRQFASLSSSPFAWRSLTTTNFVCSTSTNPINALNQVQEVTGSSWDNEVLASQTPVLVEFWAPWCGPCKMIAPVIEELAKEYSGKIACYKLNTDDSPNIATQYNIRSVPTVLFFKNGERKESIIGAVPRSTLTSAIDKYLDA